MWKLKFTPTATFAYYCFPNRPQERTTWKKAKTKNAELSPNSARKMKRAIQWLLASSEVKQTYEKKHGKMINWRVNHACLTFHENLKDDNLARKILSAWLEVAKYRWNVRQYVWKAEPQERGAIHFHLTSNVYIPHAELRYTWNRALRKHRLNNIQDNSTDVHAVSDENKMLDYFADYLTDKEKHEGRRQIKGRRWGCSHDLTQPNDLYIPIDDEEMTAIEHDLRKYSLADRLRAEGKDAPDFLRFVNYWNVSPDKIGGEVSALYQKTIKELKQNRADKSLQLFPDQNQFKIIS